MRHSEHVVNQTQSGQHAGAGVELSSISAQEFDEHVKYKTGCKTVGDRQKRGSAAEQFGFYRRATLGDFEELIDTCCQTSRPVVNNSMII